MYDADYYLRGRETGKSLYENYRWLPELTIPMAEAIAEHLDILSGESVLDFGCARGYLVKALRELGIDACGIDTSEWAIENCDPDVRDFVALKRDEAVDWIIAKDVLEHVASVSELVSEWLETTRLGILIVVPLAPVDSALYVIPEYEKDVTHIHRLTLGTWAQMFMRPGWIVEASYRIRGIKDNYAQYAWGNGFITCRRLDS